VFFAAIDPKAAVSQFRLSKTNRGSKPKVYEINRMPGMTDSHNKHKKAQKERNCNRNSLTWIFVFLMAIDPEASVSQSEQYQAYVSKNLASVFSLGGFVR